MDLLQNLSLFVRIAERGSISGAGRDMNLSPASASERLIALERHYGVSLMVRSTRNIRLTDEGLRLLPEANRLINDATTLEQNMRGVVTEMQGLIKLSVPHDLGQQFILPIVDQFLQDYPNVTIEIDFSDQYSNLITDGIDIALRVGALKDSSLRMKKLVDQRQVICASPSYLEKFGRPKHPEDLVNHQAIICRSGNNTGLSWPFLIKGKIIRYRPQCQRIINDGAIARYWGLQGYGFIRKSYLDVAYYLRSGELLEVLTEFQLKEKSQLQILYGFERNKIPRIRQFVEYISKVFKEAEQGLGGDK